MIKGLRRIFNQAANWRELTASPYGVRPALILGLIAFFQTFDDVVPYLAGPDITRELGVSIEALASIVQIVGFLAIGGQLLLGWYADRHARLPLYAGGTILSGIFSAVASRANNLFTLGAPRVVDRLSELATRVPQFSLTADYYPPETRGKAFAVMGTMQTLAAPFAPVLGGALILAAGWRTASVIVAAPLILVGLAALIMLREPLRGYMERKALGLDEQVARREEEPRSLGESFRIIFSIRTVRRTLIAEMVANGGFIIFQFIFPFYLADVYGLNAFERGIAFAPGAVMALLGGYLGGGMADTLIKRNPGRLLVVSGLGLSTLGIVLALAATQPPIWILAGVAALYSFGNALYLPGLRSAFVQVIPPEVRTQGTAVFSVSALPALIIFLPVSTILLDEYGFNATLMFTTPLFIIAGLWFASAAPFFDLDMRSAISASAASDEWRRTQESGEAKLLVCRDIDVAYDGVQVLFGVDFDVTEGEIIALLGTNGAGKSTLLKAISGTQEASSGGIIFDGRDITHMPPHEIASRQVIHMPGGRGVFPGMTVRENLLLGRWMSSSGEESDAKLREVLDIFPVLRERVDTLAGSLSGGEQQQLSLAQAFLASPKLLMIDELSLGLSPAVVDQLLDVVREINKRGVTIIVVEQSVNIALRIANRAVFMEKGEVRFFGETEELLRRPDILRAVYVRGTEALSGAGQSAVDLSRRVQRAGELDRASTFLQVENLVKRFGGVIAVDGVSLELRQGEVLGLIGPNGAGKTTIFDLISGYQVPDQGIVRMEGEDITGLAPEDRAERKLIRRFQDARLFPSLTLTEALLVALDQQHEAKHPVFHLVRAPQGRRAERRLRSRAERLIETLGLEAYRDKLVGELSTGLRRITDLACVLATEPRILLLDEPSTGIASSEVEGLAPVLRKVRAETNCSILIIEHSMSLIASVSDRLIALDQGRVIAEGLPDDVLSNDAVVESYLGRRAEVATT